ncbi:T9SS type A sorting domain-containing protein [Flavobacterium sp. RSSA_27]|uniref:T9SS type A sorting domain-containing protein n=1 Tax=Flavobacterium sp. RSSA_27 TaxID=3447667 RepID=UPI003F3AA837
MKVYNILGKEVLFINEFNNNEFKVSGLNNGLYIVNFESETSMITSKFIKE